MTQRKLPRVQKLPCAKNCHATSNRNARSALSLQHRQVHHHNNQLITYNSIHPYMLLLPRYISCLYHYLFQHPATLTLTKQLLLHLAQLHHSVWQQNITDWYASLPTSLQTRNKKTKKKENVMKKLKQKSSLLFIFFSFFFLFSYIYLQQDLHQKVVLAYDR